MAIILTQPITMPVVSERTADKLWVLSMTVDAQHPEEAVKATFVVAPYCSSTNEVFKNMQKTISVDDVFSACATNATLAQALGAIYLAVENLAKEQRLFGLNPDVEVTPVTP